jgi:AraC family transcriptional regulator
VSSSRREYTQRINRTIDYIDRHLDEPLPLDRLADVAAFSKYHFHRIFYAHVGETPGQYIQRLRIAKAAMLVAAHRDRTITDIALSVGFTDVTAFSRAFRLVYGVAPSRYREKRANLSMEDSNLSTTDRNRSTAPTGDERYDSGISHDSRSNDMPELQTNPIPAEKVTVADKPEMTVAYVRHTGPYFGDEKLFQRLFTTLYEWAAPRDLIHRGETEEIIIYHDDPGTVEPEKLRVSCCISVPADTEVSGEIGKMTIPAGRYAEARFQVDATQFGGAWNWVYGVWLPESGYQPDDRLCYEKYIDTDPEAEIDGKVGHMFTVDICVPVIPL